MPTDQVPAPPKILSLQSIVATKEKVQAEPQEWVIDDDALEAVMVGDYDYNSDLRFMATAALDQVPNEEIGHHAWQDRGPCNEFSKPGGNQVGKQPFDTYKQQKMHDNKWSQSSNAAMLEEKEKMVYVHKVPHNIHTMEAERSFHGENHELICHTPFEETDTLNSETLAASCKCFRTLP